MSKFSSIVVVLALCFTYLAAQPAESQQLDWPPCKVVENAAPAGGDSFVCPMGDIENVPDIQMGTYVPGDPSRLNGQIGAGSAQLPGDLNFQPDVGDDSFFWDGNKHLLLGIMDSRIKAHRPLIVCDKIGCINITKAIRRIRAHN